MWKWILAAVLGLLVLIAWTRVGVHAAFGPEGLGLEVLVGVFRVRILPGKPKKKKKEKKPAKPKPPKAKKKPKEGAKEKPKLSIALEDIQDALRTLLPALKRMLRRFGKGLRFRPLRLSLTLGGMEDPASAAQLYGNLQTAVWTGMPVLERLVDIRAPSVHTGVDFQSGKTAVEGEAGVTLRIGTLIAMAFTLAVPALGWFLRWQKRCKTRPPKPDKKAPKETGKEPDPPEEPAA